MNDVTIIVNSCDKYEDLWYPFFELFRMQWQECEYPIILNTESKTYSHPNPVAGGIISLQLFKDNKQVDWSTRLIKTLDFVKTDYVLMFLDDEFIQERVNISGFQKSLKRIKGNPLLSYLLFPSPFGGDDGRKSILYPDCKVVSRIKYAQNSANCSLWKKSRLLKYLKKGESIWEFECYSKRRRDFFDRVYAYKQNVSPISISYRKNLGYGVINGKWNYKNQELFEKYGILVDFAKRGVISKEEIDKEMIAYRLKVKEERKAGIYYKLCKKAELYKDAMPDNLRRFLSKIKRFGRV